MKRLDNKVSIITGAGQGIGLATALKFAAEGAIVVVCDVKQAAVDAAVAQCQALGAQAVGFVMDVTQRDMVDAVVAQVKTQFGRIDVLVNNAGITHFACARTRANHVLGSCQAGQARGAQPGQPGAQESVSPVAHPFHVRSFSKTQTSGPIFAA